jgi:hypothetical protein
MGRKRKVVGERYEGLDGRAIRMVVKRVKWEHLRKPSPRGKTGRVVRFTIVLKELCPMVYAFIVDQLRRPEREWDAMITSVVKEYRKESGTNRRRPSSLDFSAFVLERALKGAWQEWGVKPPYTEADFDSFLRRYVRGHRGALRDFRKILREPQPWPPNHRGQWLKYFFAAPGDAAREFKLLTTKQPLATIFTVFYEQDLSDSGDYSPPPTK